MKLCSRLLRGSVVALLVCLLALQAPLSHAQVLYGALVGAVKDASGAAVPGAKVVITNQQTGQVRETVTNEEGGYNFPTIQNGVYEVRITKDGFKFVLPNDEWVAFRASGTEPLVRCYLEAKSAAGLRKLASAARKVLSA